MNMLIVLTAFACGALFGVTLALVLLSIRDHEVVPDPDVVDELAERRMAQSRANHPSNLRPWGWDA